jgi:hypothetical protein
MIKILLTLLIAQICFAYNLQPEIETLNNEFNKYAKYPILIFDKDYVKSQIKDKSLEDQLEVIKKYVKDNVGVELGKYEADNILTYHTKLDNSASALPFREGFDGDYRFCAVFVSGSNLEHRPELERVLGIGGGVNPYPVKAIDRLEELFSLEELKLYSLYHELAHCLDPKYIPAGNRNPHDLHLAESFAESVALLMLNQRKGMRKLGVKRSLLRTLYTKYMGKYLATDPNVISFDETIRDGGVIYYLSPSIMAAQRRLNDYDFLRADHGLDKLIQVGIEIVENSALQSRDMAAIRSYLDNGRDKALKQYLDFAQDSPRFFYQTFLNLKYHSGVIEDVDYFL